MLKFPTLVNFYVACFHKIFTCTGEEIQMINFSYWKSGFVLFCFIFFANCHANLYYLAYFLSLTETVLCYNNKNNNVTSYKK